MKKLDEIALRVAAKYDPTGTYLPYESAVKEFAHALPADPELLAELSKDAEPVGYEFEDGTLIRAEFLQYFADKTGQKVKPLFTRPANIAEIEQRVAEACAKFVSQGARDLAEEYGIDDMGSLSFGSGRHGETRFDRYNELMELDDGIRSGKWREYL